MRDGNDSLRGLSPARRSGACGRSQHQLGSTARQMRVLIVTTRIGAAVSVFFGVQQFLIARDALWLGCVNLASAVVFLLIPQLYRFGDLLRVLLRRLGRRSQRGLPHGGHGRRGPR